MVLKITRQVLSLTNTLLGHSESLKICILAIIKRVSENIKINVRWLINLFLWVNKKTEKKSENINWPI